MFLLLWSLLYHLLSFLSIFLISLFFFPIFLLSPSLFCNLSLFYIPPFLLSISPSSLFCLASIYFSTSAATFLSHHVSFPIIPTFTSFFFYISTLSISIQYISYLSIFPLFISSLSISYLFISSLSISSLLVSSLRSVLLISNTAKEPSLFKEAVPTSLIVLRRIFAYSKSTAPTWEKKQAEKK